MKLNEFLDETLLPISRLCKLANVCPLTMRKAISGQTIKYGSALKISEATKGKVTIQELPLSPSTRRSSHPKKDHADIPT